MSFVLVVFFANESSDGGKRAMKVRERERTSPERNHVRYFVRYLHCYKVVCYGTATSDASLIMMLTIIDGSSEVMKG